MTPLRTIARRTLLAALSVLLVARVAAADLPSARPDPALQPARIRELMADAVHWGMNLAGFYELRYVFTQLEGQPAFRGLNRLQRNRVLMDAKQRYATTINASTLYSGGNFDLSREPVVVLTPAATDDRYWSVQASDPRANWFLKVGPQFTGREAQQILVMGPKWQGRLPSGFRSTQIVRAPSDSVQIMMRVAVTTRDAADLAAANAVMDQFLAMPLSLWLANGRRPVPVEQQPIVRGTYATVPRMPKIVDVARSPTGADYLQLLSLVVNDESITKLTDSVFEQRSLARLAQLGVREGALFDPGSLTSAQREAIESGWKDARAKARAAFAARSLDMSGWKLQSSLYVDPQDHQALAGGADVAWGSPVPFESHTIGFVFEDADGRPLEGARRYTLTFDVKNLPPMSQFWELPVYDELGYFVDNPLDRYSATSYQFAAGAYHVEDGRLTFYLQSEPPPDPERRRNWLPTPPSGRFQLAARFYGPETPLIDGSYAMPRIVSANPR
jgi:hypothetical protein